MQARAQQQQDREKIWDGIVRQVRRLNVPSEQIETLLESLNVVRQYEDERFGKLLNIAGRRETDCQDPRTKLLTLPAFRDRYAAIPTLDSHARWCALGVVDVRGFKSINDNHGHHVGDAVLELLARILQGELRIEDDMRFPHRTKDLHCRWGGDEFCFFIWDLPDPNTGKEVVERCGRALANFNWGVVSPGLQVAADFGFICFPRRYPLPDVDYMLKKADKKMYEAKRKTAGGIAISFVVMENHEELALTAP